MKRDDNSVFLLYIEPKKEERSEPVDDDLVKLIEHALSKSIPGTTPYKDETIFEAGGGWRGIHITDCGQASSNCDFKLENGMITNSLAPFYVKYYRNSIGENDRQKLRQLAAFYGKNVSL